MRIEATLTAPASIAEIREHGRALEAVGFDTLLVPEAGHDPFLPLMTLAEHTTRPKLGTGIAVAFPRSPMVVAQLAWDLQRFSGGRLLLGLGTQVRAHNEHRYSTPWSAPGPRLREYVQCLRAIFDAFQNGATPRFEGEHYRFTLLSPFFDPGPIPSGERIPIYVSAVNRYNCRIAGELCDGIRMHPLNTPHYVRKVIRPAIEEGAAKTGRSVTEVDVVANPFVVAGENEAELAQSRELIRRHISFYAATRSYKAVMELHGWTDVADRLIALATQGKWEEMPAHVGDEMLEELAIVGTWNDLPGKLAAKWGGLATSVNPVFGPPYAHLQQRQRQCFLRLAPIMDELKRA